MVKFDDPEYWDGNTGYRPPGYADFTVNTLKEICIMLFNPQSVLDVGCACGFGVHRLRRLGYNAVGLDISKFMLNKAESGIKPYLILGTAWSLPFRDKQFGLVFSSGVLEHIPGAKLSAAVSEMVRVGHTGLVGVSCLDDPTTDSEDVDITHKVVLTQQNWQALFPPNFIVISDSEASWRLFATTGIQMLMTTPPNKITLP